MDNKCFSCKKRKQKYIDGLCERCHKEAIQASLMASAEKLKKVKSQYNGLTWYPESVLKFAKKNCKRDDEVGELARAFLDLQADLKMADSCMQKADMWLSRAMG